MSVRNTAITLIRPLVAGLLLFNGACSFFFDDPQIELLYPHIDSVQFVSGSATGMYETRPSLAVISDGGGYLLFEARNSELCCETDSLLVYLQYDNDSCVVHIVDMGPWSWSFCPDTIRFRAGPFEDKEVVFEVLESQSAFKRDTFQFTLNPGIVFDTLLQPVSADFSLRPVLVSSAMEGCYGKDSLAAVNMDLSGPDTTWVTCRNDSIFLVSALNYAAGAPFITSFDDSGDSLLFYIEDTCNYPDENCYYDYSCYYLFTFSLKKREEAVFPYKVLLVNCFNEQPVLLWWGAIDTRVF